MKGKRQNAKRGLLNMARRRMTEEQLKKQLRKLSAKDLSNNLVRIEEQSLELANELANLEIIAEIYREVAQSRMIEIRCGQC